MSRAVATCSKVVRQKKSSNAEGGFWGSPPSFFFKFWALLCAFLMVGPDFSRFGHNLLLEKIFLVTQETKCWTKLFSDSHDFFYFFSSACFFDIISSMSLQALERTFSTYPWWYFKESCFQKDIHLVFSITFRHPLRMQASSRFWLW